MHILPAVPEEVFWQVNLDDDFQRRMQAQYDECRRQCLEAAAEHLERAAALLLAAGFAPGSVESIWRERDAGVARDIIAAGARGWDAVVVGRRGLGRMEGLLLGSVSARLLEAGSSVPVWVVGGDIRSTKMLLAVDASVNARHAVHYLAEFAAASGAEVTLYHGLEGLGAGLGARAVHFDAGLAEEWMRRREAGVQGMFAEYRSILEGAGVAPAAVAECCRTGVTSCAGDILREARAGGFGTVVLGRRGISLAREFFMGRVSSKVVHGAEGLAVWVVP
jgi:nucleotide-binding universal stress UspA family protein